MGFCAAPHREHVVGCRWIGPLLSTTYRLPCLQHQMVRSFWIGSVFAVASLFAVPVTAETDTVEIFNTNITAERG